MCHPTHERSAVDARALATGQMDSAQQFQAREVVPELHKAELGCIFR